jgi:hypothetical protein
VLISALSLLGSPGASVLGHSDDEGAPPAPRSGAELRNYLARPDHPPVFEHEGDLTAQVVVHNNFVKAVGDEEFRAAFPAGWDDKINTALERADDEMYVQFGIDFRVYSIQAWDSFPDATRGCNSSLMPELQAEVSIGTGDSVAAYTANPITSAGCRSYDYIIVARQNTNETIEKKNRWVVTQHEMSHVYHAPDRYNQPDSAQHPNDVMEDPYNGYDWWCTQAPWNDWGIVSSNRAQFD